MYEQVQPQQPTAAYAAQILETLFRNTAYGIRKTLDQPNEESIHDLRVTCLRLRHAVRVFGKLFGDRRARKVRRRLGRLQEALADVRACDVALHVLATESLAAALSTRERRRVVSELNLERRRQLRGLRQRLRKMQRSDLLQRWRNRLLPSAEP